MSSIVFEDLEENVLNSIINNASIKINKKTTQARILTKEGIVKTSNTITNLQNTFNKILAYNSTIAKIHQIEARRIDSMSKEKVMERGSAAMPIAGGSTDTASFIPELTKSITKLADELEKLNLTPQQQDAIPSASADIDIDLPDRRRSRYRRFGRGLGIAGKALGVLNVGYDVMDRASAGQSAGQIATGVVGGVGGGVLGAQAGAALGAFGGPAAPVTVPLGAFIGGTLGYFGGSAAGDAAYNALSTPTNRAVERNQKKRNNSLFSMLAKNIALVGMPLKTAAFAGTLAYSMSDKFASFLGSTMTSIGDYVNSLPSRLASIGSNIYDSSQSFGEGVELASGAVDAPFQFIRDTIGADETDWDIYRNTIAQIESQGRYGITGGSGDHYDGRYQMGASAKSEASRILGQELTHDPGSRAQFRNDPRLQERAFAAFTAANHRFLMRNPRYASATVERKLQILGYAHNQGMGGANNWLNTGVVGADGFGTRGTKYTDALARNFRNRGSYAAGTMFGGLLGAGREFVGNIVDAGRQMLTGPGQFIAPMAAVRVTSGYGPRRAPANGASSNHKGIDLGPRRPGTQGDAVFASADGVVTKAGWGTGYGNVVYINHGRGFETRYAHLRAFTIPQGARVRKGQQIGQLGNTGVGTGPHLHFEVRSNGQAIDPLRVIGSATVRPDASATEPGNEQVQPQQRPQRGWFARQAQDSAVQRRGGGNGRGGAIAAPAGGITPGVFAATPSRTPARSQNSNTRSWYQWILGG